MPISRDAWIERLLAAEKAGATAGIEVDVTMVSGQSWRARFCVRVDPWLATGSARMLKGRLVIESLHVDFNPIDLTAIDEKSPAGWRESRKPPLVGITGNTLRAIPLGKVTEAIQRAAMAGPEFEELAEEIGAIRRRSNVSRQVAQTAAGKRVLGKGRPPLSTDHFRNVAEEALRLQGRGERPLRRVLAARLHCSENTVRDWLRQARTQGWLAPTRQGQRGVMPGYRLLAIVKEKHDG